MVLKSSGARAQKRNKTKSLFKFKSRGHTGVIIRCRGRRLFNPRGDHWAEFGPRDQCRLCARPKFGPTWYDVVEQFSFPSLVTDPGKKGVIGKLIHSSSCANFNQVQNAVSPNENPRYKTRGKVVPIFG